MNVARCPGCATEVPDQTAVCPHCGLPLTDRGAAQPSRASEGKPSRRWAVAAGLLVALVMLAVAGVVSFLLLRGDGTADPTTPLSPADQFQARVQLTCDRLTANTDGADAELSGLLNDTAALGYTAQETALTMAQLCPAVTMLVTGW